MGALWLQARLHGYARAARHRWAAAPIAGRHGYEGGLEWWHSGSGEAAWKGAGRRAIAPYLLAFFFFKLPYECQKMPVLLDVDGIDLALWVTSATGPVAEVVAGGFGRGDCP